MRKFVKTGIARENFDGDKNAADGGAGANSLETDLLEVQNEHDEVENKEAEVADAVDAAQDLEENIQIAEEALRENGMNTTSAKFFNRAVESCADRLGLDYKSYGMPSTESYGGNSSRISSNQRALEGAKEMLKQAWEAILKYIRKAYDWTMKFFESVFGAATKLGERAEKLRERIRDLPSGKPTADFEDESIFKALHNSSGAVVKSAEPLETVQKMVSSVITQWDKNVGVFAEAAIKVFEDENSNVANITPVSPDYFHGTKVNNPDAAGFSAPPEHMALFRSPELPGNRAVIGVMVDGALSGEDKQNALLSQMIKMDKFNPQLKDDITVKKLPTLDATAMTKICSAAKSISDSIVAFKGNAQKIRDFKKKLGTAVERLAREASSVDEDNDADAKRKNLQFLKSYATRYLNQVDHPAVDVNKYALTTGKKYLDYVEKSIDQYGKKD